MLFILVHSGSENDFKIFFKVTGDHWGAKLFNSLISNWHSIVKILKNDFLGTQKWLIVQRGLLRKKKTDLKFRKMNQSKNCIKMSKIHLKKIARNNYQFRNIIINLETNISLKTCFQLRKPNIDFETFQFTWKLHYEF